MSISIQSCTLSDAYQMVSIGRDAFANDPMINSIFNHNTAPPDQAAEFLEYRRAIAIHRMQGDGKYHFKAVDDSSGTLVGYITMYSPDVHIGSNSTPASIQPPSCIDHKMQEIIMKTLREMEAKHIGERKDVWYVQSMVVHPGYQGRGVGTRLLRRALEEVDKAGEDVFLEASPAGARLYEGCGFEILESCNVIDGGYNMGILMRKAKGKANGAQV